MATLSPSGHYLKCAMSEKPPHEIEFKIDLQNEENYRRLIEFLNPGNESVVQSNFFFDTEEGDLAGNRWALRLRFENDRAVMTLKGDRRDAGEGLSVRTEVESGIDIETGRNFREKGTLVVKQLPEPIRGRLEGLADDQILRIKLGFSNRRIRVPWIKNNRNYLLEIDRTSFPDDSVDYELELEIDEEESYDDALRIITELLGSADIPLKFQTQSKMKRALARNRNREK